MSRTKADYLRWLSPRLTASRVLPLESFTVSTWRTDPQPVLERLLFTFGERDLIVRSSAIGEDSASESLAGRFLSVGQVRGAAALAQAIERVIESYGDLPGDHQVLVQPWIEVVASGVAFTRDPASGAPYLIINYKEGGDTAAVTGGRADDLCTRYLWASAAPADPLTAAVAALARELAILCENDALDIEFAITADTPLPVLFQVRPLVLRQHPVVPAAEQDRILAAIERRIARSMRPQPYLHGDRTLFGVMPDWNPAEIIGVRPRPLALSLYRDLVTDSIWAYQRHNYGYRNLRSFPLLVDFVAFPI